MILGIDFKKLISTFIFTKPDLLFSIDFFLGSIKIKSRGLK